MEVFCFKHPEEVHFQVGSKGYWVVAWGAAWAMPASSEDTRLMRMSLEDIF